MLRWKACGIEIRGEAAILDTGGKEITPTCTDELFRIRAQRIISWAIEDLDSLMPTTRFVP